VKVEDPAVDALMKWVVDNGGVCNLQIRTNIATGLRGLYAAQDISDDDIPLVQVPNHLIVSPLHI
jgi:hypothetical protein